MRRPTGAAQGAGRSPAGGTLSRARFAEAHGVGIETLRYYESIGLLDPPERGANGYRRYGAAEGAALRFIRAAKDRGFTLSEIKGFLGLIRARGADTREMRAVLDGKIAELSAEAEAIRARIALLEELRAEPGLGRCGIMGALGNGA